MDMLRLTSFVLETVPMLVNYHLPPPTHNQASHIAQNFLFMGLPKFKPEVQRCKHCKKKLSSSNQVVVAYEVRRRGLCMTVRPTAPKSPKPKAKIQD
jgi:hypothetical protein